MTIKTKLDFPKVCKRCDKKIDADQKFVLLGTYHKELVLDEAFFHFKCYLEWIDTRIKEHSVKQMNDAINSVVPGLKKIMGTEALEQFNEIKVR